MKAASSDPHPSSSPARVRIRSLSLRLGGRDVLRDVELTFAAQVVALVGPNGAGKTVLLRLLATLIPSFRGEVLVAGGRLATRKGAAAARQELGYLPQDPKFPDDFTVVEAVEYAAWLKRVPRAWRRQAVAEIIDELDLGPVADKKLRTLSGGTRRRAHIGQALVHRPSVLLLDEPTTGLDPAHRVDLRRLLGEVASGRLLVLSTHLTEDIEMLADRVIALQDGRVMFDGTPQQLAELGAGDSTVHYAGAIERGLRLVGGPQ